MKKILILINKNLFSGFQFLPTANCQLLLPAIVFMLVITAWLPACKPDDPTSLVVRVVKVDTAQVQVEVPGATVRVYCTEPDCIVEDIQTTGATGLSVHTFKYEAVLAIEVTKIENTNETLFGTGIADLVKNETIQVKITME